MKIFLSTLILFLSVVVISAQSDVKFDKIIKKNYDVIDVNIKKISDKEVEFTYPNEEVLVTLDLSKVAKITFKSGRVQEFNVAEKPVATSNSTDNKPAVVKIPIKTNTIAVLPVPFINTDNLKRSVEMAKIAQNNLYSQLIEKNSNIYPLEVQDLRTTNSLLKQSGIEINDIDETPIEVLHNVLGVDNILACKVNYTILIQNGVYVVGDDDFFSTISEEDKFFEYTIFLDIYKNNAKIYSKSREPFFSMQDSWLDAANYLLKRTPIYNK